MLCLPLGDTDRKSEGRGACTVWSAERGLRAGFWMKSRQQPESSQQQAGLTLTESLR